MEHIDTLFGKRGREPRNDKADREWEDTNGGPLKQGPNDKRGDQGSHPIHPDRVERWEPRG